MADTHSKSVRSYNMSRIRSKNTKPEILVRKSLFSKGYRYRIHRSDLPGKPDLVFSKFKTVIFIHGCFWHSHPNCDKAVTPKSNQEYWIPKIEANALRDRQNIQMLVDAGWTVLTVWECELHPSKLSETIERICRVLSSNDIK